MLEALGTIFSTYAKTKKQPHWKYDDLTETPLLRDYEYLKVLYDDAREEHHYDQIATHIHKYGATECGRYAYLFDDCLEKKEDYE